MCLFTRSLYEEAWEPMEDLFRTNSTPSQFKTYGSVVERLNHTAMRVSLSAEIVIQTVTVLTEIGVDRSVAVDPYIVRTILYTLNTVHHADCLPSQKIGPCSKSQLGCGM
jgi:hypothetical protein